MQRMQTIRSANKVEEEEQEQDCEEGDLRSNIEHNTDCLKQIHEHRTFCP